MQIFLVPGFFGFANLGDFEYFAPVRAFLETELASRGLQATLHEVRVRPTASLSHRAARLLESIEEAGHRSESVHLVGHSSGGLDARLLLTPGVVLPTALPIEQHARRVRSVVTVATPHRGTPLASFFSSLYGQSVLRLLSLATVYTLRNGPLPLTLAVRIVGLLVGPGSGVLSTGLIDQLYRELLSDFTPSRRAEIEVFFADVASDPSLTLQLRPEVMELVNTLAPDRPGLRMGCVVTGVERPRLRTVLDPRRGVHRQATQALFSTLSALTRGLPDRYLPPLTASQASALGRLAPVLSLDATNDGIVPSRSQVWREVIAAVPSDHLDIIGHFSHDGVGHSDWLRCGAGFNRSKFEAVWRSVVDFIVDAERAA